MIIELYLFLLGLSLSNASTMVNFNSVCPLVLIFSYVISVL